MKETRLHGRGGQGVAMAAEMLAAALLREGKHATAFPMFGFERRGAPVTSFVRFDDQPIKTRTQVYSPHGLLIADPFLSRTVPVFDGVQPGAVAVVNSPLPIEGQLHVNILVSGAVDATSIALKEIGAPITNTCMLGAFARATGWLHLESLLEILGDYFGGPLLDKNIASATRGYHEVQIQIRQSV